MGFADFDFGSFTRQLEAEAGAILARGRSKAERIAAVSLVQQRSESILGSEPDTFLGEVACGPGCGSCCVVNVAVLRPEAESIVAELRTRLTTDELAALRRRVNELHRRVAGLTDDERPLLYAACVFLDSARNCSIHPVRPLMCRSVTSTDPQACRDAIALKAFGENPTILSNLFQSALFEHGFIALARALERAGLDSRSRTLTASIRELLN